MIPFLLEAVRHAAQAGLDASLFEPNSSFVKPLSIVRNTRRKIRSQQKTHRRYRSQSFGDMREPGGAKEGGRDPHLTRCARRFIRFESGTEPQYRT